MPSFSKRDNTGEITGAELLSHENSARTNLPFHLKGEKELQQIQIAEEKIRIAKLEQAHAEIVGLIEVTQMEIQDETEARVAAAEKLRRKHNPHEESKVRGTIGGMTTYVLHGREHYVEAGRKGGASTRDRHGSEYFKKIGALGARSNSRQITIEKMEAQIEKLKQEIAKREQAEKDAGNTPE